MVAFRADFTCLLLQQLLIYLTSTSLHFPLFFSFPWFFSGYNPSPTILRYSLCSQWSVRAFILLTLRCCVALNVCPAALSCSTQWLRTVDTGSSVCFYPEAAFRHCSERCHWNREHIRTAHHMQTCKLLNLHGWFKIMFMEKYIPKKKTCGWIHKQIFAHTCLSFRRFGSDSSDI